MEFLINFSQTFAMNDVREELCKLESAAAISLCFLVIGIVVFLAISLFMREIYYCPPEECSEEPSYGTSHDYGIPVRLIANPVHRWHPMNVSHGF